MPTKSEIQLNLLRNHLRQYSISDGLAVINRMSTQVIRQHGNRPVSGTATWHGRLVTEWGLALLAKELILHSSDLAPRTLSRDLRGQARALDLVNSLEDPIVQIRDESSPVPADIDSILQRIANQQFPYQSSLLLAMARTFHLYVRLWPRVPSGRREAPFDLAHTARRIYGMDMADFLGIGLLTFLMASRVRDDGFLHLGQSNWSLELGLVRARALMNPELLSNFLKRMSLSYDNFRELAIRRARSDGDDFAAFSQNPLVERPIIRTNDGRFVIPSLGALRLRMTEGIYFDFFNDLLDRSNSDSHYPFTDQFGRVFEEYIGELLRLAYPNVPVIRERSYQRGRNRLDGPDWCVVVGNRALVAECTVGQRRLATRTVAPRRASLDDIQDKLLNDISNLPRKIEDMRFNKDIWPELDGVSVFFPMVVTFDAWWPPRIYLRMASDRLAEEGRFIADCELFWTEAIEDMVAGQVAGVPILDLLADRRSKGHLGSFIDADIRARVPQGSTLEPCSILSEAQVEMLDNVGIHTG